MKVGLRISLIASLLLLQGCVMNAKKEEAPYGGLARIGVIHEPEFAVLPQISYLGLDQVGILTLQEEGKDSRTAFKQAEQSLLESADYAQARRLLGRVLFLVPNHQRARTLMYTLDADLDQKLKALDVDPETLEPYRAKGRDSLPSLSRRFLGKADYYPLLMRMNALQSANIEVGQSLLLPAKEIRPARRQSVVARPVVVTDSEETQVPLVENIEPESTGEALVEANTSELAADDGTVDQKPEAEDPGVSVITSGRAEGEETADDTTGVQESVVQETSQEEAAAEQDITEVEYSDQETLAFQAYGRGDLQTAYELLKGQPGQREGQVDALYRTLKRSLVEVPYARGLQLYQAQKLDQAIAEFDKVLSVEPEHGQALLYKARCEELLDRLRTID